eukprot:5316812-Pleurochrysis_carterae.AAC.2
MEQQHTSRVNSTCRKFKPTSYSTSCSQWFRFGAVQRDVVSCAGDALSYRLEGTVAIACDMLACCYVGDPPAIAAIA